MPPRWDVTVSVGVSAFEPDQTLPEEMIARADEALYRVKDGGRNRVGLGKSTPLCSNESRYRGG